MRCRRPCIWIREKSFYFVATAGRAKDLPTNG